MRLLGFESFRLAARRSQPAPAPRALTPPDCQQRYHPGRRPPIPERDTPSRVRLLLRHRTRPSRVWRHHVPVNHAGRDPPARRGDVHIPPGGRRMIHRGHLPGGQLGGDFVHQSAKFRLRTRGPRPTGPRTGPPTAAPQPSVPVPNQDPVPWRSAAREFAAATARRPPAATVCPANCVKAPSISPGTMNPLVRAQATLPHHAKP